MAKNEIDIYGILNSKTVDGIIAKSEQLSYTKPDGTVTKLSEYLKGNVQYNTAEEISAFIEAKYNKTTLFICTNEGLDFKKGHFYYYSGITKTFEDITPATGGGGDLPGGGGKPILTIQTQMKPEYTINDALTIEYDWSSENTGYGRIYMILDGKTTSRREMPMNVTGETIRTWEIGKLPRGKHNVQMYVIDSSNISSNPRWTFTFTVGGLEIESEFSDAAYFKLGSTITVPFKIHNTTEFKYKIFYQIGDQLPIESEYLDKVILTDLPEGNNKVFIYAATITDEGQEERRSNILNYNILIVKENILYVTAQTNTFPGITGDISETTANQNITFTTRIVELNGGTYDVTYTLYDSDELFETLNNPKVLKKIAGGLGDNKFTTSFQKGYFILRVSAISKKSGLMASDDFYLNIKESKLYTIDPITDGLLLWLDATGRTNSDENKEEWVNKAPNGEAIPVKFKDFNFASNGWLSENGVSTDCLTINSRAYVEIGLEPFRKEITDGLTVDIEFSTRDISNSDARVISCFGGQRGFYINTEFARIGHSNTPNKVEYIEKEEIDPDTGEVFIRSTKIGPFEINFPENKKNHITFVVYRKPDTEPELKGPYTTSCMAIFINGVLAGYEIMSQIDQFVSDLGQIIHLGANPNPVTKKMENHGESKIYNLRVYNRALTMEEIVTNFVYDIKDPQLKNTKIINNKLGDAVTSTARLIPEMTFTMFPKDFHSIAKKAKQKCLVDYQSDTELGNFNQFGLIQWQGTSTLAYAVKNYRITFYNIAKSLDNVEELKDENGLISGQTPQEFVFNNLKGYGKKDKIDIGAGMKESKFTLKADYMDSSSARNTGTAMFIPHMGTEETPIQRYIPSARTCIYGFPMRCYLIQTEESDDGIPNPPLNTEKEFLGIYNFNLDKDAHKSIGLWTKDELIEELSGNTELAEDFATKYPYWDTLGFEISANSNNSAGAFADTTMKSIVEDFEVRYPDEGDTEDEGPKSFYGSFIKDSKGETIKITVTNYCAMDDHHQVAKIQGFVSNNEITGIYRKESPGKYRSNKYLLEEVSSNEYAIHDYLGILEEPNSGVVAEDAELSLYVKDGTVAFTENVHQLLRRDRLHLQKLVTWTRDCTDEEFYNDFEKHYNLSDVLDYYLLVLCNGMVDNLGKNMMIDSYGPGEVGLKYKNKVNNKTYGTPVVYTEEEIAKYDNYIWYPHFYDMD